MISKILVLCVVLVESYELNILTVFPHPGASHYFAFEPFLKALVNKGHKVTVINFLPQKMPISNFRDVDLSDALDPVKEMTDVYVNKNILVNFWLGKFTIFSNNNCRAVLQSKNLKSFLNETNKFDIILYELFNTNCLDGIIHKYKVPVIGFSTCGILPWFNKYFANPDNPSYIPSFFLDHSNKMTFIQRAINTVHQLYSKIIYTYFIQRTGNKLSKKYLGIDISQTDIIYTTSLMLVNTHYSLNLVRPLSPNIIEVGGIHIPQKIESLPQNIEKWINESSEGVIYFSLGSMIKGHTFPADKRKIFLKAFGRLPQRVLWKWENETMDEKPDNVMIQKWMPQFDILCHPNVKAFISHGGLLGTTEAVHCGVPTIVMPQFGDQYTNARALEANGGGLVLNLKEVTEEKVYKALKTVLSSKFRQQAKELSERFRDRPLPPLETAIYWVEYVARHKGAPHMRSAAVNMPFYKYYLLDVISFLLLVFGLVLYTLFYVLRFCLRRFLLPTPKVKTN